MTWQDIQNRFKTSSSLVMAPPLLSDILKCLFTHPEVTRATEPDLYDLAREVLLRRMKQEAVLHKPVEAPPIEGPVNVVPAGGMRELTLHISEEDPAKVVETLKKRGATQTGSAPHDLVRIRDGAQVNIKVIPRTR